MRWIALISLSLLIGCSSGSGANSAESSIRAALDVVAAGINTEAAVLASQPIGEHFLMGTNVASRYGAEWSSDEANPAAGRFRALFTTAFTHLANENQEFTVVRVQVTGSVATASVQSRFDALRLDSTPAENVTYSTTDYMLFELQEGGWRLVRWDEQLPTS